MSKLKEQEESNPGWNSIQYMEDKLKLLTEQCERARIQAKKEEIKIYMDIYKKEERN